MNILRESMTKVVILPWVVRVWRQEDNLNKAAVNDDVRIACHDLRGEAHVNTTCLSMAKAILELPRVNAVEVLLTSTSGEPMEGEVLYRCDEVMIGDKRITII